MNEYEILLIKAHDYSDHDLERWLFKEALCTDDIELMKRAEEAAHLVIGRAMHKEYLKQKLESYEKEAI